MSNELANRGTTNAPPSRTSDPAPSGSSQSSVQLKRAVAQSPDLDSQVQLLSPGGPDASAPVGTRSPSQGTSETTDGAKAGAVQRRAVQRDDAEPTAEQLVAEIRGKVEGNYKASPIRAAYEAEVQGLRAEADKLLAGVDPTNDATIEPAARKMNARRIEIGMKYKELTILPLKEYIFFVNKRYDTPMGPTYEWLKASGKNNQQIVDGACRPNPDVNKLLSGFGDWLAQQPVGDLKRFREAVKSE
jgi:hypothetical protein